MLERLSVAAILVHVGCQGGQGAPDSGPDAPAAQPDAATYVDGFPDAPLDRIAIGDWCDPGDSDASGANPACEGRERCLDYGNGRDGMCVVFGCREDNSQTGSNEDSCRLDYGNEYVCIDLQGNDDTNLADNVCVKKCVPDDTSNPCEDPFACTPASRRFNFKDTVCFDLGCQTDVDCPVSITNDLACVNDADCPGATDYCVLARDNDGDGTLDTGACSEAGSCNHANGLCDPHTLGSATARIGDPCQADIDCPNGGACVNQGPSTDANGVIQSPRNGYCTMFGCRYADTLPAFACPGGSVCYTTFFAGGCMRECDVADPSGCRDNACAPAMGLTDGCDWLGDYECLDLSGFTWTVDQTPVADGVICDYLRQVNDCGIGLIRVVRG